MAKYLLGQLTEQEEAELEARYLADDACFHDLLAAEQELRDAYERDELSAAEREAFQRRLLSTQQQQDKQAFARALRESLAASPPRPQSRWKLLLEYLAARRRILVPAGCAALALLIVATWWTARGPKASQSNTPSEAVVQPPNPAPEANPASAERTVVVLLSDNVVRGAGGLANRITIPAGTTRVQLQARSHGADPRYSAIVQTPEGKPVWRQDHLAVVPATGGPRIMIDVPPALLPPGDYVVTLRGHSGATSEIVAEYAFRVLAK